MTNSDAKIKIRDLTLIAVFAAVMCVISPFTIPVGPVGITLATFGAYLSGVVLGAKRAGAAVAVYLMLGLIGLPVFSGFMGGFQRLAGPTGGYLLGYIPCAVITGIFAEKFKRPWGAWLGMAVGTAALYSFGTAWFMIMSGTKLLPALGLCVLPFLPGDFIKIAAAATLGKKLREILR